YLVRIDVLALRQREVAGQGSAPDLRKRLEQVLFRVAVSDEDGTTGAATLGNLVQLVGVRTFQADHVGGNTGIVAFGSDGGYARGVLDTAAGLSVGDEENDGLLSVGGRIIESRCPRDGTVQGGRDG